VAFTAEAQMAAFEDLRLPAAANLTRNIMALHNQLAVARATRSTHGKRFLLSEFTLHHTPPHDGWGIDWPPTDLNEQIRQDRLRKPCSSDSGFCNASMPSFYLSQSGLLGVDDHPMRWNTTAAEVHVVQTRSLKELQQFQQMPRRTASRPYLLLKHGLSCEWEQKDGRLTVRSLESAQRCVYILDSVASRGDVVFGDVGLADHLMMNDLAQLPGVVMPGYKQLPRARTSCKDIRRAKYHVTFKGSCFNAGLEGTVASTARLDLAHMMASNSNPRIVFECVDRDRHVRFDQDGYMDLMNTTFALVPHGDGRWNQRFSEVIDGLAIPVVVADGWVPPLEPLIDWSGAMVWISEKTLRNTAPKDFVKLLPRDGEQIRRMRERVCCIQRKYFESARRKSAGLIKAAKVLAERRAADN